MKRVVVLCGVGLVIAFAASAATISTPICSGGGAQVINIPEGSAEISTTFTCPGFQFGANAGTAVFLDADGITPSDIVVIADVAGGSTITFVSDVDLSVLTLPAGRVTTITEPSAFVTTAVSISGGSTLTFTFSSDAGESAGGDSDQLKISGSEVPEPSPLALIGLGLLPIMAAIRRRKHT